MFEAKPKTLKIASGKDGLNRIVIILLAIAVAIPVITKSRPSMLKAAPATFSVLSSPGGYVGITGDVRHPGIYPITANAMAGSVILLAEPFRPPTAHVPAGSEALLPGNGTEIRVAMTPDGTARINIGSLPTAQRLVLGIPLDINALSETDFDRLPGIGPVLARRIIEYRHNNGGKLKVEELKSIEGIGEKKFEGLKKILTD